MAIAYERSQHIGHPLPKFVMGNHRTREPVGQHDLDHDRAPPQRVTGPGVTTKPDEHPDGIDGIVVTSELTAERRLEKRLTQLILDREVIRRLGVEAVGRPFRHHLDDPAGLDQQVEGVGVYSYPAPDILMV